MPEKKRCQMERKENKVRFCEFSEVLADWKWLLTYSRRCKKMIALYIALGVLGTTVGLFGSVAGKYLIDIVTGYDTACRFWFSRLLAARRSPSRSTAW